MTSVPYFLPGEAVPASESTANPRAAITEAQSTPNRNIGVVGHADATGAEDANIRTSLARATTIRDSLVKTVVEASVIEITCHGFRNPRVTAAPDVPEPRNRRVEITIR